MSGLVQPFHLEDSLAKKNPKKPTKQNRIFFFCKTIISKSRFFYPKTLLRAIGVVFHLRNTHSGGNPPDSSVHPGYPSISPSANFIAKRGSSSQFLCHNPHLPWAVLSSAWCGHRKAGNGEKSGLGWVSPHAKMKKTPKFHNNSA